MLSSVPMWTDPITLPFGLRDKGCIRIEANSYFDQCISALTDMSSLTSKEFSLDDQFSIASSVNVKSHELCSLLTHMKKMPFGNKLGNLGRKTS